MKIAYILYPEVIISNKSNGVRSQAETWAKLLRNNGHIVDLINNWGDYSWTDYDIIHIFGAGGNWVENVTRRLINYNNRIVFSPIIDPVNSISNHKFKLKLLLGKISSGKIDSNAYTLYNQFKYVNKILVRSDAELDYVTKFLGVDNSKLSIVPISYTSKYENEKYHNAKENFCFHISSIYQTRKNVLRLIEAAKKYNFRLILAGAKGTPEQFLPIKKAIGDNNNIKILGFISEEEKIRLYKSAKVFALPSIQEGVGIVALDAALFGCEIVLTNIPGPKFYFNNMVQLVNPYDINDLGVSIKKALDDDVKFQPSLRNFILKEYSPNAVLKKIISVYTSIC